MFKNRDSLVEFVNINFGYSPKKQILTNVSFSIRKNEYVCIIGANGCGKSTIAKILAGLFKPWSGNIIFNNKVIDKTNVSYLRNKSGIIFENPDNQFIGLTVQDDIAFGLENKCVPQDQMQSIIDKTSKYVGTYKYLKADVTQLSGGQKQLVAFTSVLTMNPDLIILDEATSMLDSKCKKQVNDLISYLKNKKGKTIVSVTHDMDEAAKADKVIVISNGSVAMVGKPSEVFTSKEIEHLSLDKPFAYKLAQRINYER